jgi:gallate dioxygenase
MATIVGAIASSHTPTIGFALDTHKQSDPNWAPIFEGYEPVWQWLAEKKPEVLFFIFNDHITSFFSGEGFSRIRKRCWNKPA